MERKGIIKKLFIIITLVTFWAIVILLFHILPINSNLRFQHIIGVNSEIESRVVSEKCDFKDLDSYADAANYYFGNAEDGYLQGYASVLSRMSEDAIKDLNDKLIYRLATDISWSGPDFMLRIEYTEDKSKGVLYSKCVHWEDKGISRQAKVKEKNRQISKKEIEAFEEALSQDQFWEIDASSYGDDGVEILFEGNDGNQYRARNYFYGMGIENIHKTLFDMEKRWILKELSNDKGMTKEQIKSVKEKFWPLY